MDVLEPHALFGRGMRDSNPTECLPATVLLCTEFRPQVLLEVKECYCELSLDLICFGEGFFCWLKYFVSIFVPVVCK